MAALQASIMVSSLSCSRCRVPAAIRAAMPEKASPRASLPGFLEGTQREMKPITMTKTPETNPVSAGAVSELMAVAEAAADRAEMHANVGVQRDGWNAMFIASVNGMVLSAAVMAGLSAGAGGAAATGVAFRVTSAVLYISAAALQAVVNKIQPSQLAEEQRAAARLLRQLHGHICTTLALRRPRPADVDAAVAKLLAVDRAYPLPLLPTMLDKFPENPRPAIWWPDSGPEAGTGGPGKRVWRREVEDGMRQISRHLEKKDIAEYVRLAKRVVQINRTLAVAGPVLTAAAAAGAALTGTRLGGWWAPVLGVLAGAVAGVVNTVAHGGQVGMIFEMYRNCAGYYLELKESIDKNLREEDMERREDAEVFELKLALKLGRSVSEIRDFAAAAAAASRANTPHEFAGKLF